MYLNTFSDFFGHKSPFQGFATFQKIKTSNNFFQLAFEIKFWFETMCFYHKQLFGQMITIPNRFPTHQNQM